MIAPRRFVRVRFTPHGKLYSYRMANGRVGQWVRVPPTPFCPYARDVRVDKLGRGMHGGRCKTATPC